MAQVGGGQWTHPPQGLLDRRPQQGQLCHGPLGILRDGSLGLQTLLTQGLLHLGVACQFEEGHQQGVGRLRERGVGSDLPQAMHLSPSPALGRCLRPRDVPAETRMEPRELGLQDPKPTSSFLEPQPQGDLVLPPLAVSHPPLAPVGAPPCSWSPRSICPPRPSCSQLPCPPGCSHVQGEECPPQPEIWGTDDLLNLIPMEMCPASLDTGQCPACCPCACPCCALWSMGALLHYREDPSSRSLQGVEAWH